MRRSILCSAAAFLWGLAAGSLPAQEVNWRYDYNTARREALDKNRPLVLDFGTEYCYWCNKLDSTTFREPTVVGMMNDKFIPIKVDATRNAALTEPLRLEGYPTVIMAAPDGKILATIQGYIEAGRFYEYLQRTLSAVGNPEWMMRDYQEAVVANTSGDYPRAIALLKSVTADGQERPVQLKARQLLHNLEQEAANRLAKAKQLEDRGNTTEAMNVLTGLLRSHAGTQAAAESGQLLSTLAAKEEVKQHQRSRRAQELLALAREDYRTKQYHWCLERCQLLSSAYGELPEAGEAIQLEAEIKNNPDRIKEVCENLTDRLGALYLALADTLIKKGETQQAINCLEKVVQTFPGSRQAELALNRMVQIKGQARPASFKK